jgi:hypothetical protein
MSHSTTSLIVLAIVFGGAVVGVFLRSVLPQPHLDDASKDTVKIGIGLVLTITAVVLSLLIASAKSYFDAQSNELTETFSRVVVLDRVLAHCGPETRKARVMLHAVTVRMLDRAWSRNRSSEEPSSASGESLYDLIQEFSPGNGAQRSMQAQALGIALSCRVEEARGALDFLGCLRRFQLRARLGPSWRFGDSSLTDPTVPISRSGFVKRTPSRRPRDPFRVRGADSRSSCGDLAVRVRSLDEVASDRYIRSGNPFPPGGPVAAPCGSPAVPHLLRYYEFLRRLEIPPCPSGRPLESRTSPAEEEMGSPLRFRDNPWGSMPRARDTADPRTTSR